MLFINLLFTELSIKIVNLAHLNGYNKARKDTIPLSCVTPDLNILVMLSTRCHTTIPSVVIDGRLFELALTFFNRNRDIWFWKYLWIYIGKVSDGPVIEGLPKIYIETLQFGVHHYHLYMALNRDYSMFNFTQAAYTMISRQDFEQNGCNLPCIA